MTEFYQARNDSTMRYTLILLFLASCGSFKYAPDRCVINPEPYKKILEVCLTNVMTKMTWGDEERPHTPPELIKACEEVAYKRTKYCY